MREGFSELFEEIQEKVEMYFGIPIGSISLTDPWSFLLEHALDTKQDVYAKQPNSRLSSMLALGVMSVSLNGISHRALGKNDVGELAMTDLRAPIVLEEYAHTLVHVPRPWGADSIAVFASAYRVKNRVRYTGVALWKDREFALSTTIGEGESCMRVLDSLCSNYPATYPVIKGREKLLILTSHMNRLSRGKIVAPTGWSVKSHDRMQAYGPAYSLRKRIEIPEHIRERRTRHR